MINRRRVVVTSALLALLAVLTTLAFYVFGNDASTESGATPSAAPVQTTEEPSRPLTHDEHDSRRAQQVYKDALSHFQCTDYPEGDALRIKHLIPTGNVVAVIGYDDATGEYRVMQSDPRITIEHKVVSKVSRENPDEPVNYTDDEFTWTFKNGTKAYAAFEEYASTKGLTWMGVGRYNDNANFIPATRDNHKNHPRYVIVGTDTSTCRAGNPAPSGMWQSVVDKGLNLPSGV